MRPIRLTLQAFGPFAKHEVIDFEQVALAGLFGIYGPTGAGKTSIFDGLCFALFGKPSGDERDSANMRSHHAAPDLLTKVELIFDLGEKRYLVERTPEQMRPAKRGGGETKQAHTASLFDATGLTAEDIAAGQTGRVIAERKPTLVTDTIVEHLGYSVEQFRQIALLPQGEFRKILSADTKERSDILRRLFDVSIYDRLTQIFKDRAAHFKDRLNEVTRQRDIPLENAGFQNLESIASAITDQKAICATHKANWDTTVTTQETASKTLDQAHLLEQEFNDRSDAETGLLALEDKAETMDALKRRAKAVRDATALTQMDDAKKRSNRALQESQQRLATAKSALSAGLEKEKDTRSALEKAETDAKDLPNLDRKLDRLNALKDKLTDAGDLNQKLSTIKTSVESLASKTSSAQTDIKTLEESIAALKQAAKDALARDKERITLDRQLEDAKRDGEAARAYDDAFKKQKLAQAEFDAADKAAKAAANATQTAQSEFDQAEANLAAVQAVHLAHKLTDGAPCPVCGSSDHPSPASGNAESQGLNQAFERARAALDNARQQEAVLREKRAAAEQAVKSADQVLESQKAPETTLEDLRALYKTTGAKIDALKAQPDHDAIEQKLDAQEADLAKARSAYEALQQDLANAQKSLELLTAQRDTLWADAPEGVKDVSSLEEACQQATQLIAQKRTRFDHARKQQTEAQNQLTAAQSTAKSAEEETSRLEKAALVDAEKLNAALAKAKLTPDAFERIRDDADNINALEEEIKAHDNALAAAQERLKRASDKLKDKTRPDLGALEEALTTAKATAQTALDAFTAQTQTLNTLETAETAAKAAQAALDKMRAEFGPIGELADLTNGSNEYNLRLVDFAIASMFDEVLESANLRFGPMTGERFELRREEDTTGGRGKRGLSIQIFDAYTQTLRPTPSLSGGEGFQAALALALGLSDVVQRHAGGVRLDAIFIDEGFGSLDSERLESALAILQELAGRDRMVGLISHVDLVKQMIPHGFDIEKTPAGSRVRARTI